jgi:hypothetical protein
LRFPLQKKPHSAILPVKREITPRSASADDTLTTVKGQTIDTSGQTSFFIGARFYGVPFQKPSRFSSCSGKESIQVSKNRSEKGKQLPADV